MQTILKDFHPFVHFATEGIVVLHWCTQTYYAKVENNEITLGWDAFAFTLGLQPEYEVLFGYIGHATFDLHVFGKHCKEIDEGEGKPFMLATADPDWDPMPKLCKVDSCEYLLLLLCTRYTQTSLI